jgi:hypothetical protein
MEAVIIVIMKNGYMYWLPCCDTSDQWLEEMAPKIKSWTVVFQPFGHNKNNNTEEIPF